MKIVCSTQDLSKGINIVIKAVPANTTMPILKCVLIDASAGVIKLTCNDTEIGIETIIDGTIEERGIIAIDAKDFSDLIRKLSGDEIIIESNNENETHISCDSFETDIPSKSGNDFSYIPNIEKLNPILVSQMTFKDIVRQTIFSIATNENNKTLTGELIEINNNVLKVVSMDGHRVSLRTVELNNPCPDTKVIVPGKTLNEIIKIIDGGIEDMMEIYVSSNHIVFCFGSTTIVSRIIDGEYFDINKMIAFRYDTAVKINKKNLYSVIDRSTYYVVDGDKKPVICDFTGNQLTVNISSRKGKMNEPINVEKEGNDIKIGLNPKFIMDALKVIDEEEIILYMLNSRTPCFIKNEKETFTYIVLPINFTN